LQKQIYAEHRPSYYYSFSFPIHPSLFIIHPRTKPYPIFTHASLQ
jgi:hypothetical protein